MIYMMVRMRVAPEDIQELVKVISDEYIPGGEKHGRKHIASWQTIVGGTLPVEVIDVWGFDDLAHMQSYDEAVADDDGLKSIIARLTTMIREETVILLADATRLPRA